MTSSSRTRVAPFSRLKTRYSAMGRFGNVFLVSGEPDPRLTWRADEVVRLSLTNTASTRVFNVRLPGARMKLVGGDSGRVEHEEFIDQALLSPSERAVVDVVAEQPGGVLTLQHQTPDRTYRLAGVQVNDEPAAPSQAARKFQQLRTAPELQAARQQLERCLAAPPDKTLAMVARMDDPSAVAETAEPVSYACPMHPEVTSDQPGRCPKCGMKLHPVEPDSGHMEMHHAHAAPAGHAVDDGIEWDDTMVEVNRPTTTAKCTGGFSTARPALTAR